jgi:3'-phosphoadenosine 5'-phosphosulfate sulfotransferase (PAPS reductase)/FAD synthetase
MDNIVSFSGGKDSTAMLHLMIEKNIRIDEVIFFDTGWEFPQMIEHINHVERKTGITITRLKPEKPFSYWMFEREIIARKGPMKGKVHRIGNGWPSPMRRWCTRQKIAEIDRYLKQFGNKFTFFIGYAYDEMERQFRIKSGKYKRRFPLIEMGITEADALKICIDHGFHWGGLYNYFSRVSCFCCPLQKLGDLRTLRKHFPDLWEKMMEWDSAIQETSGHNRGFRDYDTVHDLDLRFSAEDRQDVKQYKLDQIVDYEENRSLKK